MAIPLRLNTRRRTAVATATGLPRYARNDKVGTHEGGYSSSGLATVYYYGLPLWTTPLWATQRKVLGGQPKRRG